MKAELLIKCLEVLTFCELVFRIMFGSKKQHCSKDLVKSFNNFSILINITILRTFQLPVRLFPLIQNFFIQNRQILLIFPFDIKFSLKR